MKKFTAIILLLFSLLSLANSPFINISPAIRKEFRYLNNQARVIGNNYKEKVRSGNSKWQVLGAARRLLASYRKTSAKLKSEAITQQELESFLTLSGTSQSIATMEALEALASIMEENPHRFRFDLIEIAKGWDTFNYFPNNITSNERFAKLRDKLSWINKAHLLQSFFEKPIVDSSKLNCANHFLQTFVSLRSSNLLLRNAAHNTQITKAYIEVIDFGGPTETRLQIEVQGDLEEAKAILTKTGISHFVGRTLPIDSFSISLSE